MLVVWTAEELHLLKGDGAGEAAGNGRMKGKKRVKRGGPCKKSMTPLHQAVLDQILITFLGNIQWHVEWSVLHHKAWLIIKLYISL